MACLMLSLLGPFQARFDEQVASGLQADSVRSLLAYLAIETDRDHARRNLAGLLWPELPDHAALSNLRYALSDLRRAVGDTPVSPAKPILRVTRDTIRLDPDAGCRIDVRQFEQLCDEARALGEGEAACEALEKAVALYRGPLLEGFSLRDSAAFEDWLFWTREQYQRKALCALRRLVAMYEIAGRYEAAQAAARRQVQLEPLDEEAHRQLIRTLALGGQRSAALRQVEICRWTLAQELGVELMPETVALAEAIRTGALQARGPFGHMRSPPPSPPAAAAPIFVARDRELVQLDNYLAEALTGLLGRGLHSRGRGQRQDELLMGEFVRRALTVHPDLAAASGSYARPAARRSLFALP